MPLPSKVLLRTRLLPVSREEAFAWHEREGAFNRLTPPWEPVEVVSRTGGIKDGDRVEMKVGLAGPLFLKAVYRHEDHQPGERFCDIQEKGPFREWRHDHRFLPGPQPDSCVLEDEIIYRLPPGGRLFHAMIRRRLNRLFDYRHAITEEDLSRNKRAGALKRKTILVTGASGLIGSALIHRLTTRGHKVLTLGRGPENGVTWNPAGGRIDLPKMEGVEAVIHLAGEPVARRWTPSQKKRIMESRRQGTSLLVDSLGKLNRPPECLISASGIHFFGPSPGGVVDETHPPGEGFLAGVCQTWEEAALGAKSHGMRVCLVRTGIVLSPAGGALGLMLKPFQAGLGGMVGHGNQMMSWIGLDDLLDIYLLAVEDSSMEGPVNAVAPSPIRNKEFSLILGKVLGRPTLLPMPVPLVHLALGEMGREMLLADLPVRPGVLTARKHPFRHAELEGLLRFILGKPEKG